MSTEFYGGTDWEQTSGPIIPRQFALGDLWPVGLGAEIGGGNKDVLEDGLHPAVAIGAKAFRPKNLTGTVISYDAAAALVVVNLADKFVSRQYVANVLTYDGGNPATFAASFALGAPVYVDDSDGLSAGVTLSLSPLNSAGSANPLFGYVFYCQDDYLDIGVGGPNAAAGLPVAANNAALVESLLCVMQVNDFG